MEPETKTFDVLATLSGAAYPTDEVTVYKAPVALYEYAVLQAEANNEPDGGRVNEIDARLAELRDEIKATALKVTLRGFAPLLSREIGKQARAQFKVPQDADLQDYDDAWEWFNHKTVAESLVKVEKVATGEVDERRFTPDDVKAMFGSLDPSEWIKVASKVFELSLQSLMYDAAVTPDFS